MVICVGLVPKIPYEELCARGGLTLTVATLFFRGCFSEVVRQAGFESYILVSQSLIGIMKFKL